MIRRTILLTSGLALLLAGCGAKAPDVSFRQPAVTASGNVQSADFTNEGMPETTDSLEVSTGTGAADLIVAVSGGVLIGRPDAPVLTVYTDYGCEYCHAFTTELRPEIEQSYVEEGRLSLQLLFVPRSPEGLFMAKVALCSADQGLFRIADRQLVLKPIASDKDLPAFQKKTNVNLKALRSCIAAKNLGEEIQSVVESSGVTRVPAFELHGHTWLGLLERDELKTTIEGALKR